MQLLALKSDEYVAWAKIIENIVVVVDSDRMEKATRGEWRAGLLRCLLGLLHDAGRLSARLTA